MNYKYDREPIVLDCQNKDVFKLTEYISRMVTKGIGVVVPLDTAITLLMLFKRGKVLIKWDDEYSKFTKEHRERVFYLIILNRYLPKNSMRLRLRTEWRINGDTKLLEIPLPIVANHDYTLMYNHIVDKLSLQGAVDLYVTYKW